MRTAARKANLTAFIDKVMAPLAEAETDFECNRLRQDQRHSAFMEIHDRVQFLEAMRRVAFLRITDWPDGHVMVFACAAPPPEECCRMWREAVSELILTPAPAAWAVSIKRRYARRKGIPLDSAQIAAALAADERNIAAYPTRRRRRRT